MDLNFIMAKFCPLHWKTQNKEWNGNLNLYFLPYHLIFKNRPRVVNKHLLLLFIFALFIGLSEQSAKAQSIELLAGNTLNGAMNGVILGGATMALQNSDEFEPARVGLGAGTLYGIGVGVYDITQTQPGQQFYISGTFNDATNSSVLVLLDTIYGAAGGALIASSISLILKKPLDTALQYGSGTGAWVGFGFGLIDAFMLADGPNYSQQSASVQQNISGIITYSNNAKSVKVGMFNPEFVTQKKITQNTIKTMHTPSMNVLKLKISL